MSDEVLATINATVLAKTKESLLKYSDAAGLSAGEVIDRALLRFSCQDPEMAALLLCEEFLFLVADQTEEQLRETVKNVAVTLISSIFECGADEDHFFDELSGRVRERRNHL